MYHVHVFRFLWWLLDQGVIVFESELAEDVAAGGVDGVHYFVLKDADKQVDTIGLKVRDVLYQVRGLEGCGDALDAALVSILALYYVSQVDFL